MDDIFTYVKGTFKMSDGLNDLEWDSLSFHLPGYYDIWALSYDPYIYSCWHYFKKHSLNKIYVDYVKNDIIEKLNNLKDNELLDVYSAFCGFAIYKIEKFLDINYDYNFVENLKLIPKNIIQNNIKNYFDNQIEDKNQLEYHVAEDHYADCEHRYFHLMAKLKNNAKIKISKYSLFI